VIDVAVEGDKVGLMKGTIVCTPGVCHGSPRVAGADWSVFQVVHAVETLGLRQVQRSQPELNNAAVQEALRYCRLRRCEDAQPTRFCHGCKLARSQDDFSKAELEEALRAQRPSEYAAAPLSPEEAAELETLWRGEATWERAESLWQFYGFDLDEP
jgi:uncharacterized protein (DUF433 family)